MPTYADLLALPDASHILVDMPEYAKSQNITSRRLAKLVDSNGHDEDGPGGATVSVDCKPPTTPDPSPTPPTTNQPDPLASFDEEEICRTIGIDILGRLPSSTIIAFSSARRQMFTIPSAGSRYTYRELLCHGGQPIKQHVISPSLEKEKKAEGEAIEFNSTTFRFEAVADAIGYLGGERLIEMEALRGVGCWAGQDQEEIRDGTVVIVSGGRAARWNPATATLENIEHPRCGGLMLDFSGSERWFNFQTLESHLASAADPDWCFEAIEETVKVFEKWAWKSQESSPRVIAGLILAAWVQTVWDWRPQVAITGASKSGKSLLFDTIKNIFGPLCKSTSKPTAAGIRQQIQSTAKILLIDEFEEDRGREKILEMIRASSRGDSILMGTQDQKGKEYILRHIIWFAAIEVGLKRAPDKNRVVNLELVSPGRRIPTPSAARLRELGLRLAAIAIRHVIQARQICDDLENHEFNDIDSRIIESHAVPAAIVAASSGHNSERAKELLDWMLSGVQSGEKLSDEEDLLSAILEAHIDLGHGVRQSVGQIVESVHKGQDWGEIKVDDLKTHLEKVGLKVDLFGVSAGKNEGESCLTFAYATVARYLLQGTRWAGQSIDVILMRIGGAVRDRKRFGGKRAACVSVPIGEVAGDDGDLAGGGGGDPGEDLAGGADGPVEVSGDPLF